MPRLAGGCGLWLCALLVSDAACAPAAAQPSFTGIGTPTNAYSVSLDGTTVVGGHQFQAYKWTQATGIVDLTVGPGDHIARGVNGDGSVVVGADSQRAVRWAAGGEQSLLPAGHIGVAFSSSADGQTIVGSARAPGVSTYAFRWTPEGFQDLGYLPAGSSAVAFGVSADASVVVGRATDANTMTRAVRWTASGIQDLGVAGAAYAVSPDGGTIVGGTPALGGRAFRRTESGVELLGVLPGTLFSEAAAVSNLGEVVVGFSATTTQERAFVWTAASGMRALSDILADLGIPTTNWTLTRATGVSADGRTIVGYGLYDGQPEGFVAVIPAPATGTTLLLLFAARRRRR